MNLNDIVAKMFKDNYMDVALNECLKFRVTKDNGEIDEDGKNYKEVILKEVNEKAHDMKITYENVIELIKLFQKSNPPSGSFVHWSNLDDLMKYAEKNPKETAELFNILYDESLAVEERIGAFYSKGKEYDSKIHLGTPLFGYLLAGFDRTKYPLYKDQVFNDFLDSFSIKESMNSLAAKYSFYYDICLAILSYIKNKGYITNPTIVDVQDFIFCITQYPELYIKVGIIYLNGHAKKLNQFKENTDTFLEYINTLEGEYLATIMQLYNQDEKINKIRCIMAEKLIGGEKISRESFDKIKNEVNEEYEKNILRNWDDFGIIFPFYYEQYKKKVGIELYKIYKSIIEIDEFKAIVFKKDKYICDFLGHSNYGTAGCWIAAYPEDKKDHKEAWQLFFSVTWDGVIYGLYPGSNLGMEESERNLEKITELDKFDFNKMKYKFIGVYNKFQKMNSTAALNERYWAYNVRPSWEFCLENSCAALSYIKDLDKGTYTGAIEKAGKVEIGDHIVSYIPPAQIMALGRVTSKLFEESDVNKLYYQADDKDTKDDKRSYAQRIGVEWYEVLDKPLKIDNFDSTIEQINSMDKTNKAIFEIAHKGFLNAEDIIKGSIVGIGVSIPEVSFAKQVNIDNLYFEDMGRIKSQVETALRNGKNIILIGPPGTGKSKLAVDICRSYEVEFNMTTASSDWSTYETIGGYKPDRDGRLFFNQGIFLNCIKDRENKNPLNRWIIVDEINRADIDKAFGALFSALTGDKVMLSYQGDSGQNIVLRHQTAVEDKIIPNDYEYVIPEDFRIIGTMNTFDKSSLYEMSYAFMRRFAFIPVPVPRKISESLIKEYLGVWNVEDKNYNGIELASGLSVVWNIINKYRLVGPAIIKDIAEYVSEAGDYTSSIILYVIPQFEGLSEEKMYQFVQDLCEGELKPLIEKDMLMDFIEDFFGTNIRNL